MYHPLCTVIPRARFWRGESAVRSQLQQLDVTTVRVTQYLFLTTCSSEVRRVSAIHVRQRPWYRERCHPRSRLHCSAGAPTRDLPGYRKCAPDKCATTPAYADHSQVAAPSGNYRWPPACGLAAMKLAPG